MIHFPVSEEKNRWLEERMEALGIREKDIEEKFIRSSGRGGQKVNKTSTCVYLRHLLTGIEVKCMKERSQSLNRFLARRELVEKIARMSGQTTPKNVEIEKISILQSRLEKKEYQSENIGECEAFGSMGLYDMHLRYSARLRMSVSSAWSAGLMRCRTLGVSKENFL